VSSVVEAMAMILGVRATAAGQPAPADLSATPALAEAAQKIRNELALTPEQEARARALMTERLGKAEQTVDSFGDVSLDSVIDLLSEARAIRKEFIPRITALLTPEQKARLAKLPKSEDLWSNVTSAWMAEARLKKLAARIRLTPEHAFHGHLMPDRAERSLLFHNEGSNRFTDVTDQMGLTGMFWSGDASVVDVNDDGWRDL
jgi:hypothetical protein